MSILSNRCLYALKAILELTKHEGGAPVSISEIAERQRIPARFLEAILRQLKHDGLTSSVRGKDGGYVLALPAKEIRVGDVVRLFRKGSNKAVAAQEQPDERTQGVFDELAAKAEHAVSEVFDSVTFDELASREQRLNYVLNYSI